jgi:hypothetical protein
MFGLDSIFSDGKEAAEKAVEELEELAEKIRKAAAAGLPEPAASASHVAGEFAPADFSFEDRAYRIHFKNGNSGEYAGATLAHTFPFDPREVERVEPV